MTQRRKIAIAYGFAVPVVLAIVLLQHATLYGVGGFEDGMAQAAEVMREAETASTLLQNAEREARRYTTSAGDREYQNAIVQLRGDVNQLCEHVADQPPLKAKCQELEPLIENQIALFQKTIDSANKRESSAPSRDLHPGETPNLSEITRILTDMRTAEQMRLEQQREAATHSIRLARTLTSYGGGLLIWLVGVAAFLLFHDEKARVWAGVERRVHTKVLEVFPLGVSVTTDAGIIVYANPAEEALFGYDPHELLGGNAKLLNALEEDEGKHTVDEILERLGLNKVWSGQLPIRKKDGTIHKAASWIVNMEFPGKVYRLFVHNAD